jgi:hypothetical protein
MGRGSSQGVAADFNLVASRDGEVRGTELGALDDFEFGDQEYVALKALVSLSYENPSAPGFESNVICETAAGFAQGHEDFDYEDTDHIVAGMEQKGLVERTTGYLDIDTGKLHEEPGWKVKPAGTQLLGAFMNGFNPPEAEA